MYFVINELYELYDSIMFDLCLTFIQLFDLNRVKIEFFYVKEA